MLGDRLIGIPELRAVYDFDVFLRGYRPKTVDRDITVQYRLVFEVREGEIFTRTKGGVRTGAPWGPWAKMLPCPQV